MCMEELARKGKNKSIKSLVLEYRGPYEYDKGMVT